MRKVTRKKWLNFGSIVNDSINVRMIDILQREVHQFNLIMLLITRIKASYVFCVITVGCPMRESVMSYMVYATIAKYFENYGHFYRNYRLHIGGRELFDELILCRQW